MTITGARQDPQDAERINAGPSLTYSLMEISIGPPAMPENVRTLLLRMSAGRMRPPCQMGRNDAAAADADSCMRCACGVMSIAGCIDAFCCRKST